MLASFQITLDPFTITFLFIVAAAIVAVFVRGRKRDKCLRDLGGDPVTLVFTDGRHVRGRLTVESTGLELRHDTPNPNAEGHLEHSTIVYKNEFGRIHLLWRFCDELDPAESRRRQRRLRRTHRPGLLRRTGRRMVNVLRTLRDSLMEVLNLLVARAQRTVHLGRVLSGQEKYVSQIQGQIIESVTTSYEPLLERHIGRSVLVEVQGDAGPIEYIGILKEYTADFVELLDVPCPGPPGQPSRTADLVVPRSRGIVRHLAE